jgi:zinc protease
MIITKEIILTNGLRIIAMERHISPIAVVHLWVGAGSADEDAELTGCAHLLEHMLPLSISKSIYQVRYIKEIGGILNCGVHKDFTFFSITCSNSELNDAFGFIANLLTPSFNDNIYKREKNVVMDEILLDSTIPKSTLDSRLWEEAFKGYPYERSVKGTLSSIKNIELTDLKKYFESYYVSKNITIVIVGDFNADSILKIVEDNFGLIKFKSGLVVPTYEMPTLARSKRVFLREEATSLAFMKIGWLIPSINSPDRYPIEVLKSLMCYDKNLFFSRSFKYQYRSSNNIAASCHFLKNGGLFVIEMTCDLNQVEETENKLIEGLLSLEDRVNEEKVTNGKSRIEYEYATKFLKCFDTAFQLGFSTTLMGSAETYDKFMSNLQTVTKDDILEVLGIYFKNTPYVSIVTSR